MEGHGLLTFLTLRGPSLNHQRMGICHSSTELCGMLLTTGHVFILIAVDQLDLYSHFSSLYTLKLTLVVKCLSKSIYKLCKDVVS